MMITSSIDTAALWSTQPPIQWTPNTEMNFNVCHPRCACN